MSLDLSPYNSAVALEVLTWDQLKEELGRRNLPQAGNKKALVKRLWANELEVRINAIPLTEVSHFTFSGCRNETPLAKSSEDRQLHLYGAPPYSHTLRYSPAWQNECDSARGSGS